MKPFENKNPKTFFIEFKNFYLKVSSKELFLILFLQIVKVFLDYALDCIVFFKPFLVILKTNKLILRRSLNYLLKIKLIHNWWADFFMQFFYYIMKHIKML